MFSSKMKRIVAAILVMTMCISNAGVSTFAGSVSHIARVKSEAYSIKQKGLSTRYYEQFKAESKLLLLNDETSKESKDVKTAETETKETTIESSLVSSEIKDESKDTIIVETAEDESKVKVSSISETEETEYDEESSEDKSNIEEPEEDETIATAEEDTATTSDADNEESSDENEEAEEAEEAEEDTATTSNAEKIDEEDENVADATSSETLDIEIVSATSSDAEMITELATNSDIEAETATDSKVLRLINVEATKSEMNSLGDMNLFGASGAYTLTGYWMGGRSAGSTTYDAPDLETVKTLKKITFSKYPEVEPTGASFTWDIYESNGLKGYIVGDEAIIYAPKDKKIFLDEDASMFFSVLYGEDYDNALANVEEINNLGIIDTSLATDINV